MKTKQKKGKTVGEVTLSSFVVIIRRLQVFYHEIFVTVLLETAGALVMDLKLLNILCYGKASY